MNYLKEKKKEDYSIMLKEGTLNSHLKELQEIVQIRIDQIITELNAKSNLTEDMKDTDVLYWVGTMNAIKQQADEIILKELIYV